MKRIAQKWAANPPFVSGTDTRMSGHFWLEFSFCDFGKEGEMGSKTDLSRPGAPALGG